MVGCLIGLLASLNDSYHYVNPRWPEFNGLLFFPALYLAILLHELGHALAGTLAGFELGALRVGGFLWLKSGNRWSFQFQWRCLFGGCYIPRAAMHKLAPGRVACMIAAGPLVSFATAAACLALCAYTPGFRNEFLGPLFWASALIGLASALPFRAGLNRSDGSRLLLFWRDPEQTRRWLALVALQSEDQRGVLPRDWDPELCREALSLPPSAPEFAFCQLLKTYRAIDLGQTSAALQALEQALSAADRAGKVFQQAIYFEAAASSALVRQRPEQARVWYERGKKLRKPESIAATEAAIAFAEDRYADALALFEAARAYVDRRKLDSGIIRFAKRTWSEYQAVCRARMDERDTSPNLAETIKTE